jgi:hypothetical protein
MTLHTVPVQIPRSLYRRLERLAGLTHRPVEEVVTRTLDSNLPPALETWPDDLRVELLSMESLSDDDLWVIARSTASAEQQELQRQLLDKNGAGTITEAERRMLAQLGRTADQRMVRKAYAYVLLKWRGHRLPTLDELESQA